MNGQLAVYREFGSLKAPEFRYLPEGLTLDELRQGMTCLPHDFDRRGVICINGRKVARSAWHLIRPKAQHNGVPVEVTFHAIPMGGGKEGGGKNILAIVAGIAHIAGDWPGVRGFHDLKTRTAGSRIFVNIHIELDGDQSLRDAHAIGAALRRAILEAYPQADVIVHKDVAHGPATTDTQPKA